MIPFPNVIAGILIGIANTSWLEVLVSACVWPFVFCVYTWIFRSNWVTARAAEYKLRARRILFGSPRLTCYVVEFITALATALPVALLTFAIKRLVH